MMIQLLHVWLLFFAIRTAWCERQLRMLAATAGRLLRRWIVDVLLSTQSVKAKSIGTTRRRRARLGVVILTLERRYWRAAKVPSKRMTSTLRLQRRQP